MAISIGQKGWIELSSSAVDPHRKVKIVSFVARSTAGGVVNQHFDPTKQPVAVIDVKDGKLRTAEFSDTGDTTGELTQLDTGPSDTGSKGHICWAIYTDTGI